LWFPAVAASRSTHLYKNHDLLDPLQTLTIGQRREQERRLTGKGAEMRWVLHALLLLAAFTLFTCSTLVESQKPRAERPVYTLGERWIRSDGVYELIRVEDGRYIFAAGVDRQLHLTQDLMPAKVQKGRWVMEFDPPPKLTWPLEVGKWGTSSGIWRIPTAPAGGSAEFTWSVKAYEDVQVPAGTFKAFRISLAINVFSWGASQSGYTFAVPRSSQLVNWYAPEARQFVKAEGFGMDLLAFQAVALERPAAALLQVARGSRPIRHVSPPKES
jgi:hypothetical protein